MASLKGMEGESEKLRDFNQVLSYKKVPQDVAVCGVSWEIFPHLIKRRTCISGRAFFMAPSARLT